MAMMPLYSGQPRWQIIALSSWHWGRCECPYKGEIITPPA